MVIEKRNITPFASWLKGCLPVWYKGTRLGFIAIIVGGFSLGHPHIHTLRNNESILPIADDRPGT
jgi:hypothetical protein